MPRSCRISFEIDVCYIANRQLIGHQSQPLVSFQIPNKPLPLKPNPIPRFMTNLRNTSEDIQSIFDIVICFYNCDI